MKHLRLVAIAALALLTACSSSDRPVYSGKQESTEGVPGFVKGKKVSPHVKLGQSYRVAGETYVPRHEPDYDETGMASWYGPGFHGGKTANGERFDANELTAAHRTLPLPSIVRVTLLSTGKQVIVRVNDRGPFAHSRIIDLSRGAAEKIGLLRSGTGKVRVEYMEKESARFAELLGQGRSPKSIDLASEILEYNGHDVNRVEVARSDTREVKRDSFWASSANAAEPQPDPNFTPKVYSSETNEAAPVSEVESADLSAPIEVASIQPAPTATKRTTSPFDAAESDPNLIDVPEEKSSFAPKIDAAPSTASSSGGNIYVQLGAFQNKANAEKLRKQYADIDGLNIVKKTNASGSTLYHVRMGPYADSDAGSDALAQLEAVGADPKIVRE